MPPSSALPKSRPATRDETIQALLAGAEAYRGELDLLEWTEAFRTEQGDPVDFDLFPFQREMHEVFGRKDVPSVDVMKSSQCGISALGVSLTLYAGDQWNANVLYVLPGGQDAYDFSDTRIKPAIEDSPYISALVASTDNKGLKRIGDANLYFRGSISERKALSIPADILVLDEYDHLDQANIPMFRRRLGSPRSLKLERRFSNPSYPESGIHALFLSSDQREWFARCGCGHEAPFAYDEGEGRHHVDEERESRVCGRCGAVVTAETIAAGRWVAAHPGRPLGYHISKLIVPGENMGALISEHHKTDQESVQAHVNQDLGQPYAPKGGSLARDRVLACRRNYECPTHYDAEDWVTAGIDVGRVLHVRISRWLTNGKAVPLWIGEVEDFDALRLKFSTYNVNFAVIDERPEERAARAFMTEHLGRVALARWSGEEQRDPIVHDTDKGILSARRTGACDRLVDAFQRQLRLLPRDLPSDYVSQVTSPHRVTETNARGQKIARYVNERPDHYFFAECYDLLAKETRGGAPAGASGPAPRPIPNSERPSRWRT